MKTIAEIEEQVMKIFNVLLVDIRRHNDKYYLILLFLSLYKDDEISKLSLEDFQSSNESLDFDYYLIIKFFRYTLRMVSISSFDMVMTLLFQIDKVTLKENFQYVFEYVLYQTRRSALHGKLMEPVEITKFISSLINSSGGSIIFNPFAHIASYGIYLDESLNYLGQEYHGRSWALSNLRLKAHNRLETSKYLLQSSNSNWPDKTKKFDYIITNISSFRNLEEPFKLTKEELVFEKGMASLTQKGKLIVLLTETFLYRELEDYRMRKDLIDRDLIDTIILLPREISYNEKVILILNKNKKMPRKVRFINAEKFINSKDTRNIKLDNEGLYKITQEGYQDSECVRNIDNSEIIDSRYNLNVPRYFLKDVEGMRLGDILEKVKVPNKKIPYIGKFIRIRHLMDNKFEFKLDFSKVENRELDNQNLRKVSETCLLLSKKGRQIKPTLFEYTHSTPSIYLDSDILSFKVNDKIVDFSYLINELHAGYVKEQLDAYRLGFLSPEIQEDDLLNVVIKLPSLAEQKAKVEGVLEQIEETKKFKKERDTLLQGQVENSFNEFASLKHTLGRPRTIILGWADNIYAFFEENYEEIASLNKSFEDFYGRDLFFAFKDIKNELNFMTLVLQKGEKGLDVDKFEITPIPLSEIKDLINNFSNNKLNFKIKINFIDRISNIENLETLGISANKELLKILIDNLLANADKHAFDKNSQNNEVFFELSDNGVGILVLQIGNNGKPFPKNYNREKFTTKYSTANSEKGSGLGGYDIHRIATKLDNPNWELILNEDPIYPVIFEFQFPIQIIK